MRLAIIDLGTNSVRFDVVELGHGDEVNRLYREKLMIRLGEGVFLKKKLHPRVAQTCISAFESFRRTMDDFRVNRVAAFGTAALRVAQDGDKFIRLLKKRTGISLKVISGSEEASLIARGILKNEKNLRGRFALIDIGGGSTEISICHGKQILHSTSFALGTASLQQVFLKTIPPDLSNGSVENLRKHIRAMLLYKFVSEEWPSVKKIIGSSGTVRALTRLNKRYSGSEVVKRKEMNGLVSKMIGRSRSELAKIPGMESRRVDMILAGSILMQECMHALKSDKFEFTEYSLRDGILDEQIDILHEQQSKMVYDPIKEIFNAAISMGSPEKEVRQSINIANDLFDRLKTVHRLGSEWKKYFVAASILQGVGRSISPIRHAGHSAYIARHVDVSGLSDWESRFIAELCVHHYDSKINKKNFPFKKDQKKQRAFFKILALMRIAVGLAFQRTEPLHIERVRVDKRSVKISVSRRSNAALALLRADHRKNLFEETFKKTILFEKI